MKIKGGYYIKSRCIQESAISIMPPCTREVWDWLLKEASHEPIEMYNHKLERGQCLRSYSDIQEGLAWKIGYIKCKYSKGQIKVSLAALRRATMVDTRKNTHGLIITILNYDRYQNQNNYARHTDRHNAMHTARHDYIYKQETINNNKDIKTSRFAPPLLTDVVSYINERGSKVDPKKFFDYYETNGWVQGKARKPIKNWKACVRTWETEEKPIKVVMEDYMKGKQLL